MCECMARRGGKNNGEDKMSNNDYRLVIGDKNYSSWSLRPWLLMRMFGIAFEEINVDI